MENIFEDNNDIIDDFCDLDRNKICDNCGKCIESDNAFNSIKITKIIIDEKDN